RGDDVLDVGIVGLWEHDGTSNLDASGGIGDVYIDIGSMIHVERGISLTSGQQRITVPSGARIAGRVEVDGGGPSTKLRLQFTRDRPHPGGLAIPRGNGQFSLDDCVRYVDVTADGHFSAAGFTPG